MHVRTAVIPIDPAPDYTCNLPGQLMTERARMRKLRKGIAGIRGIIVDIR